MQTYGNTWYKNDVGTQASKYYREVVNVSIYWHILKQINSNFFENRVKPAIPNEVVCVSKVFSTREWINWVRDEKYRRELMLRGDTFANVFLQYRRNYQETMKIQSAVLDATDVIPQIQVSVPDEPAEDKPTEDNATEDNATEEDPTINSNSLFQFHNTDITMV